MNNYAQNTNRQERRRNQTMLLLVLVLGAVFLYGIFADSAIDEAVTGWFYNESSSSGKWNHEKSLWVQVSYQGVPLLTATIAIAVFVVMLLGIRNRECARWRGRMLGLLLLIVLGPGLIVNATLKDHWGRPRPRDTEAFGGTAQFQAPFVITDQGGKSFPCGHCSIPFALGAVAWWFQRRTIRASILAGATAAGMITGMARVAVGAHYLSDVLASGWAVGLAAWTLSSLWPSWLRLADRVDASLEPADLKKWVKGLAVSLTFVAVVVGALLAVPYDRQQSLQLQLPADWSHAVADDSAVVIHIRSPRLAQEQEIALRLNQHTQVELQVRVSGFGFPWNKVRWNHTWLVLENNELVLVLTPKIKGIFTEFRLSVS